MTGVGVSQVRRPALLDPADLADGGAAAELLDGLGRDPGSGSTGFADAR